MAASASGTRAAPGRRREAGPWRLLIVAAVVLLAVAAPLTPARAAARAAESERGQRRASRLLREWGHDGDENAMRFSRMWQPARGASASSYQGSTTAGGSRSAKSSGGAYQGSVAGEYQGKGSRSEYGGKTYQGGVSYQGKPPRPSGYQGHYQGSTPAAAAPKPPAHRGPKPCSVADFNVQCRDASSPNVCSNHGKCRSQGSVCRGVYRTQQWGCACYPGFIGQFCETTYEVKRKYACGAERSCGGRGKCVRARSQFRFVETSGEYVTDELYVCRCEEAFMGAQCHLRKPRFIAAISTQSAEKGTDGAAGSAGHPDAHHKQDQEDDYIDFTPAAAGSGGYWSFMQLGERKQND